MSELAFNANGETFEVPASVTGWRVRRMKPRGAPELVYGRDGRPLVIPIESDTDDLRNAVMTFGKYRLDPVNEDGRTVENVPAAYVQVIKTSNDVAAPLPATRDEHEDPIREAMRLNTELAKAVIDRFPEVMTAAADLLRAADGAGLPARAPRMIDADTDEDEEEVAPPPGGFDLNAFIGQIVPVIMAGLANGNVKLPGLGAMLDWRKAAPAQAKRSKPQKQVEAEEADGDPVMDDAFDVIPPIDPQTMSHFIAVQSALKPEEAAVAREVASKLTAAELRGWFDELSKLSVPQAVQKIRVLIAGNTEAVS